MNTLIGLIIIAIGAFCQSSSYVPINKIKSWSWESYWLVQGVFAWLVFPLLGALLAVPAGHSLFELYATSPKAAFLTMFFGLSLGRSFFEAGSAMDPPPRILYPDGSECHILKCMGHYPQGVEGMHTAVISKGVD